MPQFVGKDSDGDGIPDLVEQYGLKPDGTPIHSDPHLKDTDGDGLSDNEELGFVPFDAVLHASGEYLQHISYRSDPNNPDTDGDGFPDNYLSTMSTEEYYPYTDPNPTISDVTIHRIEHEDYLRINNDNTPSFGSAQGWLGSMTDTMFCNGKVTPSEARAHGCGFIAACDVLAYLNIHNGMDMSKYMSGIWYRDTDTTTPIRQLAQLVAYDENTDLISKDGYLHYLQQMSDELCIHTSGIAGVRPFGEQSLESVFNEAFEMCDLPYEANWCFDNSEVALKKRILEMIGNNIPVIFAYDREFVFSEYANLITLAAYLWEDDEEKKKEIKDRLLKPLDLYIVEQGQYSNSTTVNSHYMTITAMIEYSDSASELIGHSTMLEVSSWGEKYYIDFEQYCTHINEFDLSDYAYIEEFAQIGKLVRDISSNIFHIEVVS